MQYVASGENRGYSSGSILKTRLEFKDTFGGLNFIIFVRTVIGIFMNHIENISRKCCLIVSIIQSEIILVSIEVIIKELLFDTHRYSRLALKIFVPNNLRDFRIRLTLASSQLVTSKSCACMAPTANEFNIHFEILPILNFLCLK